jgi:hypothetical protein
MEERWIFFRGFGSGRLDVKGQLVLPYQQLKAKADMMGFTQIIDERIKTLG